MRQLRLGVVAGEASGDALGARLIMALRERCEHLIVEGIGGPLMQAQGCQSLFPMQRLAVMGLIEPLKRLPELLRIRRSLHQHFLENPPDVFLAIDAPDFNLPLERKLRRGGVPTAHLVSPSVWAWRKGRISGIRSSVDLMLCLFPFEAKIYEDNGIEYRCVGHPLADDTPMRVDRDVARAQLGLAPAAQLVALLPGSRVAEVRALAPLFFRVASDLLLRFPLLSFVTASANSECERELRLALKNYPQLPITLVQSQSREVMTAADAVLLASGTATLEAALLKRPMAVAYRMGAVSWALMSRLLRVEHVALPNLLAGKRLVPELLQDAATPAALGECLTEILQRGELAPEVLAEFDTIHNQLQLNFAQQVAESLLQLARDRGSESEGSI